VNTLPVRRTPALSVTQLHVVLFAVCSVLTLVLYLKGGATNPFVSLYLVPIAVSAATLSLRFTIALAIFCVLAYSLLMFFYEPLQLLSPNHAQAVGAALHEHSAQGGQGANWHLWGMWLNFVLSALLITYFVVRLARVLRAREVELTAIREKQLRDEQLLGIATLAAGTLHELGTPLATMTLLADDLKLNVQQTPELAQDVELLAEQLARCKLIMQSLARAAETPSDQLQQTTVDAYLDDLLAKWQLLMPGVPLRRDMLPAQRSIYVDSTFEQALINLLNNAAEASPSGVELSVVEDAATQTLSINIRDHGAGVSVDADKIGKPFVSTRGQGRGLGLFLSNATIERLGGKVMLQAHPEGGTLTTVTLPFAG
jgi:two-component system sensor histidine kinase RegB